MLAAGAMLPTLPGHPGFACPLRTLTGIPCPLCGMTTSVEDTVHLELGSACAANPAGVLAVLAAIAVLVLRPRNVIVPTSARIMLLAGMWIFELHRFGFI